MSFSSSKKQLAQRLKSQSISIEKEIAKRSVHTFINEYCKIYNPKLAGDGKSTELPFKLYPKQHELVDWLIDRENTGTKGIIEKSREEGVSFLACVFMLHRWLFFSGWTGILGSAKRDNVDKLGDPTTLFFKLRYALERLPEWLLPKDFEPDKHDNFTRLINPETGSQIIGASGKQFARGGRASFVFLDEDAFIPHAQEVHRAVSQVSDVVIEASTPNGVGNAFYEDRFSGKYPVFTMSWRDNPNKDKDWYEKKKRELDPVTLAQEINIDYGASVPNIVIPNNWVVAATEIQLSRSEPSVAAVDVAGEGSDYTVYAHRNGGVVTRVCKVTSPLTNRHFDIKDMAIEDDIEELFYDEIAIGGSITATLKSQEEQLSFAVTGVANNRKCTDRKFSDQPTVSVNSRFANWVAEQWWALRIRFENTYKRLNNISWSPDDECIQIPKSATTLIAQLSQPTYGRATNGKIRINKFGKGLKSPDEAEALLYTFSFVDNSSIWSSEDLRIAVTY